MALMLIVITVSVMINVPQVKSANLKETAMYQQHVFHQTRQVFNVSKVINVMLLPVFASKYHAPMTVSAIQIFASGPNYCLILFTTFN
jgi:hypothetical protein